MKKQWLPLVVAVFFLAPVASAADGSAVSTFEHFFGQLVAFFTGEEADLGHLYPPNGEPATPTGPSATDDLQEIGELYPPNGQTSASIGETDPGDQQEIGHLYPPHG